MHLALQFSYILIGFSYSFLLLNKIYFGISLLTGIILMMILNRPNKISFHFINTKINFFFFTFLIFLSSSTINSIIFARSISVEIYLILFILLGLNLFFYLQKRPEVFQKIIKILIISTILNVLIIFLYYLINYGTYKIYQYILLVLEGNTLEVNLFFQLKFKGILNVITILVLILTFFRNKLYLYLPIIFLIPSLILSDSNAPLLGISCGLFLNLIFFFTNKIKFFKKTAVVSLFTFFFVFSFYNLNNLPAKFDVESINNFEFKVPTSLIDTHRQFIWGFSLTKSKNHPFLGYGPDTSNFIDGSQKIIGHEKTGDMTFIPSHPHNFFIEILLELGIFGAVSFILFVLFLNYEIFKKGNNREKFYLIFFNGYFWGSSLVNFSFWLGWWQGSYFFILSLIATQTFLKQKIDYKNF